MNPPAPTMRQRRASGLAAALARLANSPGDLAAARRAAGSAPDEAPALWPYTVPVGELGGRRWQDAVFYTLTLYAVHQQSQPQPMNQQGVTVGQACAQLKAARHSPDAIDRRFTQAVSAEQTAVLATRLRGLVTMLRSHAIPLDYVHLAFDLQDWHDPESRRRVLSRWSRDYYRTTTPTPDTPTPQEA